MKSILTLTIGLLLSYSECYSQSKIELGIRFIPQATTFRYTQGAAPIIDFLKVSAPYYFRVRTAQGLGLTYNPVPRIRLGVDLLYSLQGAGYDQRQTNVDYLKVPIWIGYNSLAKRRVIFTIQSGVELSYLVRARMKYRDGESVNIREYVNSTSWGIPFAIGVKFKVFQSYYITTQLYLSADFSTLAKTNASFGVYNYVYPGLRICIDQNLSVLKGKIKHLNTSNK